MQCVQTMIGQRCWHSDPVHAFHWSAEHVCALHSLQRCADPKIISPRQSMDFDQSPQPRAKCSQFTLTGDSICGDACPLSCVNAAACLTGWPNAWVCRVGKLVNAELLSLINEVCVCVWMYVVLPYSRVNSSAPHVCRHDCVTQEAGHVGLMGRDWGSRGYWVTLYLFIYTAWLLVSVFC